MNGPRRRFAMVLIAQFLVIGSATRAVMILSDLVSGKVHFWLLDWNVYYAAAIDLVQRTLYRVPLNELGATLPVDVFNYPPLAAAWAVPFLPLGRELGGLAFVLVGLACVVAGLILTAMALKLRPVWLWVPAMLFLFLLFWVPAPGHIALGNNNDLMFLLVAGFVAAHVSRRERLAGVLLALAIATKIWPIALLLLIVRERRWTELQAAAAALAVQGVAFLLWLGPDVARFLVEAVVINVPRGLLGQPVIWTTAFRATWDWWPLWGTYVVAIVLVLLPAKGRLGLGLGILGGLALNANLWHHYIWVFLLGVGLSILGIDRSSVVQRPRRMPSPHPSEISGDTGRQLPDIASIHS